MSGIIFKALAYASALILVTSSADAIEPAGEKLDSHPQRKQIEALIVRLEATRQATARTRLIAVNEVFRTLQNARGTGLSLQWTFPETEDGHHFLSVALPAPKGVADDAIVSDALRRGREATGSLCYFLNPRYAAVVEKGKEGYKLIETYGSDTSYEMQAKDALAGLHSVCPLAMPIRKFLSHPNTIITSFSQNDKDVASIKCSVSLNADEVLWKEPFLGQWEAEIDATRGGFISQRALDAHVPNDATRTTLSCRFAGNGDLDQVQSEMAFGDNFASVIRESYDVIDLEVEHDLDESACYLSHYGLPEPAASKAPGSYRTQPWLYYFFGGLLCVAVGAFFVYRVTRRSERA